jgi:hypothetical protein
MWKVSRTARKRERARTKTTRATKEREQKGDVRKRDRFCRFPRCGCRKLGVLIKTFGEVSHDVHKGAGGNPLGDRSVAALMILLCRHRHQDGHFSRHKGTLRVRHLTAAGNAGPIAWDIDTGAMPGRRVRSSEPIWRELAREKSVQTWEPFTDWQLEVLDELAAMEL